MTIKLDIEPQNDLQLVLARVIDAPVEKVFRAWSDPEILQRWFAPHPWVIKSVVLDNRPGGGTLAVMADPEGNEYPVPGQYLEFVPNERIVSTDAYIGDWKHGAEAFMTTTITFEKEGGKTRYIARCQHWTAEQKKRHEGMGFHEGWGQVTDQLEKVAQEL